MEPFTHIYCDNCDDIQSVQRNGNLTCGLCGSVVVKMDDRGRGYCEVCQQMQPLEHEPLHGEDVSGQFIGGDILCGDCRFVITTVFMPKSEIVNGLSAVTSAQIEWQMDELSHKFQQSQDKKFIVQILALSLLLAMTGVS